MEIYLILYTILIISCFFDRESVAKDKKNIILIILVIIFTLFRGLRWKTGTDWEQFYTTFQYANWDSIFSYSRYGEATLEFGYVFLNVFIKTLGGNYTAFLVVTNFIILLSYKYFSVQNSKYPVVVFTVLMFTSSFFPVRQYIAFAIFLFGFRFLLNKNFLKYALVIIIASTIHTSALILLPFYYTRYLKINTFSGIALFSLAYLLGNSSIIYQVLTFLSQKFSFLGDMVLSRMLVYMDYAKEGEGSSILSAALVIFFIYIFGVSKKKIELDSLNEYNLAFNAYLIYACIFVVFGSSMQEFQRLSNYFLFGFPVLLALLMMKVCPIAYRPLFYCLFISYMFYKFYNTITYNFPALHVPYRSIFDF